MESVLDSIGLYKTYDGKTWALEDFTLTMREGEVLALLGRNGAGKTTFVRIASTQLKQTRGDVIVLGHDVLKEPEKVRPRIAVMPQEGRPESLNTPWEHVYLYLAARGMSLLEARRRAERYLKELELWEYKDVITSKLSGGLRQRVLVAMAAATEAELIFLDEPTLGLDPISRIRVWRAIKHVVSNCSSVLLTTHNMEEAELLADQVAFVEGGRLLAVGTISEVKSMLPDRMRVELAAPLDIGELRCYGRVINLGSRIRVYTNEPGAKELVELAINRGFEVSASPIALEDVFISLVGAKLDEDHQ